MAQRERELEAAANLLDRILDRIKSGELQAPGRVAARLEGAVIGLRQVAKAAPTSKRTRGGRGW